MRTSLAQYSARDVLGLVVYRQHLTKRLLGLIQAFDELFMFDPKPIIVVCDDATALYHERKLKVTYSPLFTVDSVDGTISDVDVDRIFTTLCCASGTPYDFTAVDSLIAFKHSATQPEQTVRDRTNSAVRSVLEELEKLERRFVHED